MNLSRALAFLLTPLALVACGDGNSPGPVPSTLDDAGAGSDGANPSVPPPVGTDDGGLTPAIDSGSGPVIDAAPPPPTTARIRFINLSSGGAGFDFCFSDGSTFSGIPLIRQLGGKAAATGLTYEQITSYVELDAQSVVVGAVPPGTPNCDTASVQSVTPLPAPPAGSHVTIAMLGAAGSAKFLSFVDAAQPTSGKVALRFVNAAPDSAALDVGTGSATNGGFHAVFSGVAFGAIAPPSSEVDANGYAAIDPAAAASLSVVPAGGAAVTFSNLGLVAGQTATLFAVPGPSAPQVRALLCVEDDAQRTAVCTEKVATSP